MILFYILFAVLTDGHTLAPSVTEFQPTQGRGLRLQQHRKLEPEPIDAYIIAPPEEYSRVKLMLDKLAWAVVFTPHQVEPVKSEKPCHKHDNYYVRLQRGCWLAHQGIWSNITASGKVGFVVEDDATIVAAPEAVGNRLREAAAAARASRVPAYLNVGHEWNNETGIQPGGLFATTAYFINPMAAKMGLGLDSCGKETLAPLAKNGTRLLGSQWANIDVVWYRFMCCDPANSLNDTTFYINQQLREGQFTYGPMCETRGPVRCTWYDSLDAVTSCPLCSGGGLFVQNKTIAHTPKPP